ncbi:MAG TPA: hypothetical protein VNK44_00350 [Candidatus Nitrosotenuis sp.]|nr:hypothetical protein [Candidatus Nitrosotenuis sp.]
MKKSAYIVIGILVLGGFGMLGYFVGQGIKSEIELVAEMPLVKKPALEEITGSKGIKINE